MNKNVRNAVKGPCAASLKAGAKWRRRRAVMAGAGSLLMLFSVSAYPEVNVSYTYDALGRISSIVYTDGTKTSTVTYAYDASGNRTSVVAK